MDNIIIQNTQGIQKDTEEYLEILNSVNMITHELFITDTIKELNSSNNSTEYNQQIQNILSYFEDSSLRGNSISKNTLFRLIKSKIYQFEYIRQVAKFAFLNSKSISMIHYKNLKDELVSFKKMPDETFSTYYSILWQNLRISFWDHENLNYHYYDPKKFNFTNSIRISKEASFEHNEYWFNNTIKKEKELYNANILLNTKKKKITNTSEKKKIHWEISKTAYSNNEISISASKVLRNSKGQISGVLSVNIELLSLLYEYLSKIKMNQNHMHVFIYNKETNQIVLYSPENISFSFLNKVSFFDKIQTKREIYNLLKVETNKGELSKSYSMKSIFNIDSDFYRQTFLILHKNLVDQNIDINNVKQYPFNFNYKNETYLGVISTFHENFNLSWVLGIIYAKEDLYQHIRANTYILIYFSIFIVILGFLIGLYISSNISFTLETLAKRTKLIGNLKLSKTRYSVESIIYEFKQLNDSFNSMILSLRSFRKYIPAEVVRFLLLKSKEATLGGKREILTIYFSDITNFTTISEKLSPEKLVYFLSAYLESVNQIIQKNEGTLDKYIGDAVVSFWGAPQSIINHAFLSCKTAIEVQKCIEILNREKKFKKENIQFNTRIGIHTGEVIVGNIGSKSRLNYTVIGDSVNLASRLEGLNKFYNTKIICSETTYNQVYHQIVTRKLDYVAVKGKNIGIFIYEIVNLYEYVPSDHLHFISIYEKALNLYLKQKFQLALQILNIANHLNPSDFPVQLLTNRCHEYLTNPPGKNWDGIYVFKEK